MVDDKEKKAGHSLTESPDPKRFQKLSQQLLYLVNLSGPKSQFMSRAAVLVLEYSGLREAELLLILDEEYYRCSASLTPNRSHLLEIEPVMRLDESMELHIRERLSKFQKLQFDVLFGTFADSTPLTTGYGSIFFSGEDGKEKVRISVNERIVEHTLDLVDPGTSVAVIPVVASGEKIGLLTLKSEETGTLSRESAAVFEDIARTLGVVQAYRKTQYALKERVKELTCIYDITHVSEDPHVTLEEILHVVVRRIPPAWQFPDIAACRISLDGAVFESRGFAGSMQKQAAEIIVKGEHRGVIEVVYTEYKPMIYEGPFLREERNLINAIGREISKIIERKEAEKAESELQEQLRHADRLATIGQLSAGIAHELNEPLGNILGFAQLISRAEGIPEETARDISKIISSSLKAREIVKKLMLFARQAPPRKVACDLNSVMEEGLFFLEARIDKASIKLDLREADDLPVIFADPSQLHQVLINLSVNAIQAMEEGGTLTIETGRAGEDVFLAVEDTGSGMDEKTRAQIFNPFFTTKDIHEGTGLGLAVVHGIISSHKGRIDVESTPGKGSRFTVMLPVHSPGEEASGE